jgi:hypothetical protein
MRIIFAAVGDILLIKVFIEGLRTVDRKGAARPIPANAGHRGAPAARRLPKRIRQQHKEIAP